MTTLDPYVAKFQSHVNDTAVAIEPIEIIKLNVLTQNSSQYDRFTKIISHLYQYSLLKDILDFTTVKIQQNLLKFNIQESKLFDVDDGNCQIIDDTQQNKFSVVNTESNDSAINRKHYVINIKKIEPDTIIHEIAHMVERELDNTFDSSIFYQTVMNDIQNCGYRTDNISLKTAIKSIMITEIARYPKHQITSELFARYFQMLASTVDIMRYGGRYSYSLLDMANVFINTNQYIATLLQSFYKTPEYYHIKEASKKYIKNVSDIHHKWSEQKIHSFYKDTQNSEKKVSKWSKSFKSIKESSFQ